jgi:hypothetical protein
MSAPAPFAITAPTGFLVAGDTKPYREYFRKLGGKWCAVLNGWWFDELLRASVLDLQAKAARGELPPLAEDEAPAPRVRAVADPAKWREDVKADGTRAGKKWTPTEEEDLLKAIQSGQELAALAVEHKRTEGSLQARLGEIALRLEAEGKSEYEIVCRTGLSPEQIKEYKKGGGFRGRGGPRVGGTRVAAVAPTAKTLVPSTTAIAVDPESLL